MFPQSLNQLPSVAKREQGKALDALTICTACQIAEARGEPVLDAQEQQKIEDYWKETFALLIANATTTLTRPLYEEGNTVTHSHEGSEPREIYVASRWPDPKNGKAGFDGMHNGVRTWGYDSGILSVRP